MPRDSILVVDPAGWMVRANRRAHEIATLQTGANLGRSDLEPTPPDTCADLVGGSLEVRGRPALLSFPAV